MPASSARELWSGENRYIRNSIVCHNTFFAVRRDHAELLVTFPAFEFRLLMVQGNRKELIHYS